MRQNVPKVRLSDPCFQRNFLSFNHLQREDDIPPPFHTNRISIAICRFLVPERISVLKSIRSETLKQNGALKSRPQPPNQCRTLDRKFLNGILPNTVQRKTALRSDSVGLLQRIGFGALRCGFFHAPLPGIG